MHACPEKPSCKGGGERRPEEAAEEVDGGVLSQLGSDGECTFTVYAACTWTEGTGVKYSQRSTKGKKSKTSSGPCKGLQQERKECSVLYNCAGFNSVCFVGVIVLKKT